MFSCYFINANEKPALTLSLPSAYLKVFVPLFSKSGRAARAAPLPVGDEVLICAALCFYYRHITSLVPAFSQCVGNEVLMCAALCFYYRHITSLVPAFLQCVGNEVLMCADLCFYYRHITSLVPAFLQCVGNKVLMCAALCFYYRHITSLVPALLCGGSYVFLASRFIFSFYFFVLSSIHSFCYALLSCSFFEKKLRKKLHDVFSCYFTLSMRTKSLRLRRACR